MDHVGLPCTHLLTKYVCFAVLTLITQEEADGFDRKTKQLVLDSEFASMIEASSRISCGETWGAVVIVEISCTIATATLVCVAAVRWAGISSLRSHVGTTLVI